MRDIVVEKKFLEKLPTSIKIEGYFMANEVAVEGVKLDLKKSLKVKNHSPSGFNWGYSGSGPAQFALALLLKYVNKEMALKDYMDLKFGWVSGLPSTDFVKTVNLKEVMTEILNKKSDA